MTLIALETLHTLAEALSPTAKQLAAGLLRRPLPSLSPLPESTPTTPDDLAREMAELYAEAVPVLREALADIAKTDPEEVDELVEDISAPLFALVEGARALHQACLAPEAEAVRPYLVAIVEDPAVDALELFLHLIQGSLNSWELFEDPENPDIDFSPRPDAPAHMEALKSFCRTRPGLLSAESLARLSQAVGTAVSPAAAG